MNLSIVSVFSLLLTGILKVQCILATLQGPNVTKRWNVEPGDISEIGDQDVSIGMHNLSQGLFSASFIWELRYLKQKSLIK